MMATVESINRDKKDSSTLLQRPGQGSHEVKAHKAALADGDDDDDDYEDGNSEDDDGDGEDNDDHGGDNGDGDMEWVSR
ncbi:hypothetical protein EMCRGX_G019244 [Ephydatia muelleri]